jgi:hypothetical protein
MNSQAKIVIGGALAALGGAGISLSSIFGWVALSRPWGFLLGFILGISTGIGVVLAIVGMLECRRSE